MKPIEIPVPPPDIVVSSCPNYYEVGFNYLSLFRQNCRLKPESSVLEVGCGTGRIAAPLTTFLSDRGSYCGIDIVTKSIDWCRAEINSRFPHFEFQRANIQNGFYNMDGGILAKDFVFPYEDNQFDLVYLTSVFTHMMPNGVVQYLREIARVLKPGGHLVSTFFLINAESKALIAMGKAMKNREFGHRRGDCYVCFPKRPQAVVAYDEDFIRAQFNDIGLSIGAVYFGLWSGRPGGLQGQDTIFAVKG